MSRLFVMNVRVGIMLTICSAAMLISLASCSNNSGTPPSSNTSTVAGVSFSRDIQPLFDLNCVICHQGTGQTVPGSLSLASGVAWGNLINVQSVEVAIFRVAPGHPEQSYLINKLAGNQTQVGGIGVQMPYDRAPLSAGQIAMIEQWIAAGAPNN
jgi:hypothetical protein